jgi:hypothetical protein
MILSSQGNRPSLSDHRLTHKIADSPQVMAPADDSAA